jgi:hypothetical protein
MLTLAVVAGMQAEYASSGNPYGFGNMVVSDPWATGSSVLPRWP